MYGYNEENIDQLQMWEKKLGQKIDLNRYYCSPFREDSNPKCSFKWVNNVLMFIDFGDPIKTHRTYHDLNDIPTSFTSVITNNPIIKFNHITTKKRKWTVFDKNYWQQYEIKSSFLEKENIHSNEWFRFFSKKRNKYVSYNVGPKELSYSLLVDDYIKIYNPFNEQLKWISNVPNIIGGENDLPFNIETLIIQKSAKDYIICKYIYDLDCVWFQNEGMIPERLLSFLKRVTNVIIMFDNDNPGILAANKLKEFIISAYPQKNVHVYIMKNYKNVSDAIEQGKKKDVNKFIRNIQNLI